MAVYAERYHDISTGHRVCGHESKCKFLHGHNYRVHFKVRADQLDSLGRVVDFGVIKLLLCDWLEANWDHRFLVASFDPLASALKDMDPHGVVLVNFNPTAENLAVHLVNVVAPDRLFNTGCVLVECRIEETRKCSASYTLEE